MTDTAVSEAPSESQVTSEAPSETTSNFSIPEQYADKGWAQNVKGSEDLWDQFANAQSLLGKRPAGIPAPDAPQEEWDKFNAALGVPDSPDKYEFSLGEDLVLPEGVDIKPYEGKAKELFHKLGLPPEKANLAWNEYMRMELEAVGQQSASEAEQKQKLDEEFDKITNELYGDRYGEVSQRAQEFIVSALPDNLKPVVSEIAENPRALVAMISLAEHAQNEIQSVKQKYGAEDKLASGVQTAGMSEKEVVAKLVEANQRAKAAEPFSQERKMLEDEIGKLRGMLGNFYK